MKKVLTILIMMSMILSISLASAEKLKKEDFPEFEQVNERAPSFNIFTWFRKNFGIGESFSVVGNKRGCGEGNNRDPHDTEKLERGDWLYSDDYIEDICSSGEGLINTYAGDWSFSMFEISSEEHVRVRVTSSEQITFQEGNYGRLEIMDVPSNEMWVETYCCPNEECGDDDDCEDIVGPGSQCIEEDYDDSGIEYWEDEFSYCTSDIFVECWYQDGNDCEPKEYRDQTECPAEFDNKPLYDTESECLNNIKECSSGETECRGKDYYKCENGDWTNKGKVKGRCGVGCLNDEDCGSEYDLGSRYCQGDNVVQDYNDPICSNYGCSNERKTKTIEQCENRCSNGGCVGCNTEYDEDCNGEVTRTELGNAVKDWLDNTLSRNKLGGVISSWAQSSGISVS